MKQSAFQNCVSLRFYQEMKSVVECVYALIFFVYIPSVQGNYSFLKHSIAKSSVMQNTCSETDCSLYCSL